MNKKKEIIGLFINMIVFGVSTFLLFVNERYISDSVMYSILNAIAISLITTVFISIITFTIGKYLNNNKEDVAEKIFPVLRDCIRYGLHGIHDTFPLADVDIKNDFVNCNELYIVMNDAKSLISSNLTLFNERIKKKGMHTFFVLQDFNCDDIMSALTRKNEHDDPSDPDYYKDKIRKVISYHISRFKQDSNGKHHISLYLSSNYNTLGIILSDNYAMISIYRVSSGKTQVPHFVFRKGSLEYDNVREDVQKLIRNSKKTEICVQGEENA